MFSLSDESPEIHFALVVRSVLYRSRSKPFREHVVLCEHHAPIPAVACGARVPQRRGGDGIRGTSAVRTVVPVGGVGIDRLVDRGFPGKCAYGAAPGIVSMGFVARPVATAFPSGPVDRLGLLVYQGPLIALCYYGC